jgi:PhzF family phenazine biosynthesis protein
VEKGQSTIRIPIYYVDAFAEEPFRGNPAAVCVLEEQFPTRLLQSIAAEMNLSETAFFHSLEKKPLKESKIFSLRWFTPKVEMVLCGHATLATAAVLFYEFDVLADEVTFETKSGKLIAKKDKDGIVLDFPLEELVPIKPRKELLDAIGIDNYEDAQYSERIEKLLIRLSSEEVLRNLKPNFEFIKASSTGENIRGVIVTSPSHSPYDFISRFFAPWIGINEDPVTGAAHSVLASYWSKILGKKEMLAYQASLRGGEVLVRLHPNNNRVNLIGKAITVLRGELCLPEAMHC